MFRVLLEVTCPKHGLERFSIKVAKKYNIPSKHIVPRSRRKPKPGGISRLYIGRSVTEEEIKRFVVDYLSKEGVWKTVLSMRVLK